MGRQYLDKDCHKKQVYQQPPTFRCGSSPVARVLMCVTIVFSKYIKFYWPCKWRLVPIDCKSSPVLLMWSKIRFAHYCVFCFRECHLMIQFEIWIEFCYVHINLKMMMLTRFLFFVTCLSVCHSKRNSERWVFIITSRYVVIMKKWKSVSKIKYFFV